MATRVLFHRRASALVDQRDEPRHRVEGAHVAATGEEVLFDAVLADISSFGCRLGNAPDFALGQHLWLRLPDGFVVEAKVAWSRDGEAGCRFAVPITQTVMRSLLPGAIEGPAAVAR